MGKRKILTIFIIIAALAVILSGCGNGGNIASPDYVKTPVPTLPDYTGEITFSYYEDDNIDFSSYITAFNMDYPDIRVISDVKPSKDEYYGTLDERINSGEIGDVFILQDSDLGKYANDNKLLDMTASVSDSSANLRESKYLVTTENAFPAALLACSYDDGTGNKLFMSPISYSHELILMNMTNYFAADLTMPADDWSYDIFKNNATAIKEEDNSLIPIYMDYKDPAIWQAFVRGFGGNFYDKESKKVNLTDEKVVAGLRELGDLYKNGLAISEIPTSDKLKDAGMVAIRRENLDSWISVLGSEDSFEWELMHFPRFDQHSVGVNVTGLAVPADSENTDMAQAFALFSLKDTGSRELTSKSGIVPALKTVAGERFWRESPVPGKNTSAFVNYYEADFPAALTATVPVKIAEQLDIGGILEKYINGQGQLEDLLKTAETTINS
ncbi:MAG: extracellular solute-binding protein [Clostridiales bacterium]|nr:extracellular solute-binding protein [Clostridiales bacterium]